ncbi:hypothetical protein GWI33_020478 [Rhynchophorus ferrugineus]|uniref:Uncharacterized protein n=1 Tax=Rhynchophorus ferrugineus TaxID=354439 RepID=A0A834HR26_RHYFE|nr:hypothetical protein GWI33_020478 [Rhynchophorus ferrugineus]
MSNICYKLQLICSVLILVGSTVIYKQADPQNPPCVWMYWSPWFPQKPPVNMPKPSTTTIVSVVTTATTASDNGMETTTVAS